MMSAGITLLLFILLAFGMPVAFALVVSGSVGLYLLGGLDVLAGVITTTPLSTAGSYELISIPMFILMAEFVILSGVADDLFKAASTWVGRVPGGLGMCDIRIASETASFAESFVKVGLIPGDGGAWLLPRVVGMW